MTIVHVDAQCVIGDMVMVNGFPFYILRGIGSTAYEILDTNGSIPVGSIGYKINNNTYTIPLPINNNHIPQTSAWTDKLIKMLRRETIPIKEKDVLPDWRNNKYRRVRKINGQSK